MPFFVRFDMWKACTTVLSSSSLLSVGVRHYKLVFLYYSDLCLLALLNDSHVFHYNIIVF